jgi:hypothetical protein
MRLAAVAALAALALAAGCRSRHEAPPPPAAPAPAPAASFANRCTVDVEMPTHTAVGATGIARVTMRTTDGFHVNQEAPFEVAVAANELALPRGAKLGFNDATVLAPAEVKMDIPFTASAPGRKQLSVQAKFGICSESRCSECRRGSDTSALVD